MEMNHDDMKQLIDRYLQGTCTEDEARMVNSHFNRIVGEATSIEPAKDLSKRKRRVWKKLGAASHRKSNVKFMKYTSIAAVLALVFLGLWYIDRSDTIGSNHKLTDQREDVSPGSYGATLTLADGHKITLDSTREGAVVGQSLTYEDGSPISGAGLPINEIVSMTAMTSKGQVYTFTLSDGSKVWLNADSRLTFPSRFEAGERKVTLEGEAYFEIREQPVVNQDKGIPFVVSTAGQKIEVTGTRFNVSAYTDQKASRTTLVEGAVKVNGHLLIPGQQSVLLGDGKIKVQEVDVEQAMGWQRGDFIFRGETLEEVFRDVQRWYNVEVHYQRGEAKNITVGGTISRSKSLRAVLALMESTGKVKFEVSGNVVTVM